MQTCVRKFDVSVGLVLKREPMADTYFMGKRACRASRGKWMKEAEVVPAVLTASLGEQPSSAGRQIGRKLTP